MGTKSIVFFAVFVTVSALLGADNQAAALRVSGGGGVLLSREERFPLKAQADVGLLAGVELPLRGKLAARLALGAHNTWPSSLAGGFAYRGFGGAELRLLLAYRDLAALTLGGLRPGLGLAGGLTARYDRYQYTRLYFFYLGLAAAPELEIPFPRRPQHALTLSLPLKLYFRRDLALSAGAELAVGWKFYPARRSAVR